MDLGDKLVTIHRGNALIAAITARNDGCLRVDVFRPLDATSAECLIGLGQVQHPEHGVCMHTAQAEQSRAYSQLFVRWHPSLNMPLILFLLGSRTTPPMPLEVE